ncbi:cyltransferase family protein [Diaporthe amygdali]|uniref:cyltransferase family protein n=1 Tax=Phomopsis amygdali TaxID=1214568 RepID=UPI0022FDDC82|nr:cyltransferase family protein [Diaporthe amygdali]KAJ0117382.1 cyltransferase family protein [Diaporthe amygdali]
MAIGREGNVKWVDGLRGIASALVVLTHLARAWDGELFVATSQEDAPPRFLQLPYLRILIQGRIGVTIFAFVTGYVCALKPIKLCRQGNQEAAFVSVSKSALRRTPRLFLPAAAATAVSWLLAEMGLYAVAKHQDSWWIDVQSPNRIAYLGEALGNLIYCIVTTWTRAVNDYDNNQWTLLPLLKGSMWVYSFMVATAYVKPRYRTMASFGLWVYFYCASDSAFGMQFFWGTFIADLQNHPTTAQFISDRPRLSRILSTSLVFIGLTFASFPEGRAEWMTWSRLMLDFMRPILPDNPDFPRFASGIGLEFISLGILFSPWLQKLLSGRFLLFLGRMSFAVYLLHGPLMKTTLVWMLYGVQVLPDHENDQGEMEMTRLSYPGNMALILWQFLWLPMLYGIANLWMTYVDPWCERMTNRLVEYVTLDASEKPPVLPGR